MDADDARHQLESERGRLEDIRSGLEGGHLRDESEQESLSGLSHLGIHGADTASETFEREKDFAILEQIERELNEVDLALARLDEGAYGRCEVCHDAIDDERLAAMPFARFCLAHQANREST